MAEFIANPRRAPRAPARCRAAVSSPLGHFEAETEDIGSMGCQVVSPKAVHKGDMLALVVFNEKLRERLKVTGRVAWVSAQSPWRVGIAFDEPSRTEASRWFDDLVGAFPGLGGYRRVPDRIRADQPVYLGAPPRFLVDFSRDEAAVLRAIGSGTRVDELRAQLHDTWPAAQRALFSLIARQVITFQRGQAVHPETWTPILHEIEASLAVEALAAEPLPPAPPPRAVPAAPPRAVATPQPMAPPRAAVRRDVPSRSQGGDADLDRGAGRFQVRREAGTFEKPVWAEPVRDGQAGRRAGTGWPQDAQSRSPDAQAEYERGLADLDAADVNGAIDHLRRALSLAPGDPEIASRLGRLAFRGSGRH